YMVKASQLVFLVTQSSLQGRVPSCETTLCMDADAEQILGQSPCNPSVKFHADSVAYVMFTSGSTGRPKGVVLTHGSLRNLIQWNLNQEWLVPARTLQFASSNFDASFHEMMTALGCGGSLVMVSEVIRRDAMALWDFINEARVERLFMPFVMLQQLATLGTYGGRELRDIVSSGELLQLTPEIGSFFQRLPKCRLHNHYGPTESHVVTAVSLTANPAAWPTEAPIGRPISNSQIYLLDREQQPVPIGVTGELYIGGICLGNGYLNRPELTAERFLPDSFSDKMGKRIYRTGDLCRWNRDGELEFMARCDEQVKYRGYRVELGEIEAAIYEDPEIAQAVVSLRQDQTGNKRLVAYYVPTESSSVDALAIKD
ncbi:MAG: amino acid adenylation domain-containing protein, partial [Planctomycetaceae bacterium]|nr:amino acid adenylation domain-containing protein [Planctomycetaceae bacterium]